MNSGPGTMGSALGTGRSALSEALPVGYKRTEVGVIPSEWQVLRIGDLFESTAGGDFDPSRSSDVQGESHPYPIYANGLSQEGLYGFCNYAENRLGSITVTARGTLGKAFYRDTPFVAIGRLLVLAPKVRMDARYFAHCINHSVHFAVESTGVPQLTAPQVARYLLSVPPEAEQRAIAEALSDVDGLIGALEKLIAKKRAIKQAAMQPLLTGKTRLPGFSGAWETRRLGNIAPLQRGFDLPTSQIRPGSYAVVYSNGVLHRHERAMAAGPGVVTGRSGTIGKVHFIEKDYWPHNTSLWVTSFCGNDPKFVYYFYTHLDLTRFLSGSGVPTLNRNDVHQHLASCPSLPEQRAIAAILSDMDDEIAALERRRDKTRAIKQGMMQQLLTGRVRLVKPE